MHFFIVEYHHVHKLSVCGVYCVCSCELKFFIICLYKKKQKEFDDDEADADFLLQLY